MKHSEKVLAFIGKWLNDVQTKPGGYAIAYDYKHNPQKLTFYRAYKSYNETMAESIFAPSWEAYLDDDVLEKEVTDALNKLKEKVDRWHVCEEDGYERRRMMKIKVTDAVDFGEIVWNWAEMHPEAKKDFRITYEYVPDLRALRLTMERAYTDETKYGIVRLLPEDILGNMVCPSDYINATLEEMYGKLTESEETERRKLCDYVRAWLIINAVDHDGGIKAKVEICGNGYAVDLIKESDGNSISASGYIARNNEDKWELLASELYKKFKEKERKEMPPKFTFAEEIKSVTLTPVDNDTRLKMAKAAVVAWYNEHNGPSTIGMEDVYIVWFCKVLQNWKALAGTHHGDGMYYEITFDGDKDCAYVDAYKKWHNVKMEGSKLREAIC